MDKRKYLIISLAVACLFTLAVTVGAAAGLRSSPGEALAVTTSNGANASLQQFSLAEMAERADKIFRGTVVDVSPGTLTAGGGELPIVIYLLRVDEAFKGEFDSKGDVSFVEFRVVGYLKDAAASSDLQQFQVFPDPPQLRVGYDYLLLTTPPSAIGLSTAVGLGQGSFEIFSLNKQEWAKNEFNNAGLYDGAVPYSELAGHIEALVVE